jgi:hypothetical protein
VRWRVAASPHRHPPGQRQICSQDHAVAGGINGFVLADGTQTCGGMHGRHSPVQEEHHQRPLPPSCLALRLDDLRRGCEQSQRLTLGVGVEPGDGAPERERFLPRKAEALGHNRSPQREHWSTVDPKRMMRMTLFSHDISSIWRLYIPAMVSYALLLPCARPHASHSGRYTPQEQTLCQS